MADDDIPAALAALGKFEILGKLGEGGMGAVYKARRSLLQDVVALKVMGPAVAGNPDLRTRFLREMRATVRLDHPHVVRAFDAEAVGELLYLVMEYVEGVTLQQRVKQQGPAAVADACRWAAQAAAGLQHAHEMGLVHRDVKPANLVLAAKDEAVKVLDFGLVQVRHGAGASLASTKLETFMGTPEYVAPEQATDAATADIRADVYSLGCTLYFLLVGRPPFAASTMGNLILAHLRETPVPLAKLRPEVPAGLSAVAARMLAKKPSDRYQTPGEVAEALRPFATGSREPPLPEGLDTTTGPSEARVIGPRGPARPAGGRRRIALLAGLVAAALFLLGAVVALLPKEYPSAGKTPRPAEMVSSIGTRLVMIPAGTFWMGTRDGDPGRDENEGPSHEVEISEFYCGAYEVTQAEYETVMGKNPSYFSATGGGKDKVVVLDTSRFPVESVWWEEAMEFCRRLTELDRKAGILGPDRLYRLPTEAEWEYACRGGARGSRAFHFGDSLSSSQANFDGDYPFGGAAKGPDLRRPTWVGTYAANPFGLFDMHGNVREWCLDWYDKDYYASSPRRDPTGPPAGSYRVYRGGSWAAIAADCRSARRISYWPRDRNSDRGFRVVVVPSSRADVPR